MQIDYIQMVLCCDVAIPKACLVSALRDLVASEECKYTIITENDKCPDGEALNGRVGIREGFLEERIYKLRVSKAKRGKRK